MSLRMLISGAFFFCEDDVWDALIGKTRKILQNDNPDVFVLATNVTTTVRDFVRLAFSNAGYNIEFEGEGVNEIAKDLDTGEILVRVSPRFYRPAEVDLLIGDYSKANRILDWKPQVSVERLCKMMIDSDLERVRVGNINF